MILVYHLPVCVVLSAVSFRTKLRVASLKIAACENLSIDFKAFTKVLSNFCHEFVFSE